MPLTVRAATEADIPRIVEVSMAAFDPATDVMSRRLIPNCKGENNSFSEEFRNWSVMRKSARLVAPRSIMLVAVDDEPAGGATAPAPGRIVGYAVWFRPLAEGEEEEAPTKPKPPVAGLDMEAVATLRGAIMKDEYDSFGDKGAADVWTLDSIGVDPEQHRRGIGKMLLKWGLDKAQEQGRDCYLVSTPSGLPLYLSAGFERQRDVMIFEVLHVSMMKWHEKS